MMGLLELILATIYTTLVSMVIIMVMIGTMAAVIFPIWCVFRFLVNRYTQ